MQLTIFTEGKNISFNVQDDQGAIFIQSCRDRLVKEGLSTEEVASFDNDKVVRRAIGSIDYNSYHKATRMDRKVKVFSLDDRIADPDKDAELPRSPSAENEFFAKDDPERIRETIKAILPQGQAEVVRLHALEGLTFDEIGKQLGKKPDTCAHSFYDAMRNLKKNKNLFR